jgi:hypothetical protein
MFPRQFFVLFTKDLLVGLGLKRYCLFVTGMHTGLWQILHLYAGHILVLDEFLFIS